jgi:hypothetical protein
MAGPLALVFAIGLLAACGESRSAAEGEGHGQPHAGAGGFAGAGGASGGAGAGAGGALAGSGGAGPAVQNPFPCEDPTPVIDPSTGFVECSNGYSYRAEPGVCPLTRRAEQVPGPPDPECLYDSDCSSDPKGYCQTGFCVQGCTTDADCNAGLICACGLTEGLGIGSCVLAQCSSGHDCQPGLHCALIVTGASDSAFWVYACQLAADRCVADDDCPPGGPMGGNCELGTSGRFCGGNL